MVGVGRLAGYLVGEPAERVDVPLAAALGHQPSARPQRREETFEEALVIGDPMEDGVGESGVDRLVERQLGQARADHGLVAPQRQPLEHGLGHLDLRFETRS